LTTDPSLEEEPLIESERTDEMGAPGAPPLHVLDAGESLRLDVAMEAAALPIAGLAPIG